MSPPTAAEKRTVLLLGLAQFVNILNFMIVMPLGPDFARDLGIDLAHLGIIGGSYTAAAAVAGLLGSLWLDRFARRPVFVLTLIGLALGTAGAVFANSLEMLVLARIVAGIFGGPATAMAFSIIADVVPAERRGWAMGLVGAAFSLAAVLGVPISLELAELGSWHTPFLLTAGLALAVALLAARALPRLDGHVEKARASAGLAGLVDIVVKPTTLIAILMSFSTTMGTFIVIPNIAAFVQGNMGFPRGDLSWAYLVGGVASLVATRYGGLAVDRFGAVVVSAIGTALFMFVQWGSFVADPPLLPVLVLFILLMSSATLRIVSFNTISSKVPSPEERARFMSLQAAVQHAAAAVGAMLSSQMLTSVGPRLVGMERVAMVSIGLAIVLPLTMAWLQQTLTSIRNKTAAAATPAP